MKSIRFLGAAGEVTGSGYLLTTDNGDTYLIDLGMFQGNPESEDLNFAPLDFDVSSLKAVFLTHAHIDHCGRLPLLYKKGYHGKVYATKPTQDIAHISLLDSAKIAKLEHPQLDVYDKDDVQAVFENTGVVGYDEEFEVGSLKVIYRDAGHILGSASIVISEGDERIVFSGDLGNTPQDLIKPTEYIERASTVVMESTYGDSVHPQEDTDAVLQSEINEVEKTNGVLLIPAFSVERTQELLHIIGHLKSRGVVEAQTPVYVDSPMAIKITEVFKKYPNMYNSELANDEHPFEFEGVKFTKRAYESKAIREYSGAKVVIAGSGMMSGGRIIHHLHNYLSLPSTRLLIVGYQAEGTLGREIEGGAEYVEVKGENIPVRATITRIHSMSSHADQPRLLHWLKEIDGVKQVFIVHGEEDARAVLTEKIKEQIELSDIVLPLMNEVHEVV